MSSPKSSLAVSATAYRAMALGSLLELHAVRVLGRALPANAPPSANAQSLLPSRGGALRGRLRPTPAGRSARAPRRERGGFPSGPGAPPAAGASPGSGTAASGISSGCEWLWERAGSGAGSGPGRPGSAMWELQTAPGERRARGARPRGGAALPMGRAALGRGPGAWQAPRGRRPGPGGPWLGSTAWSGGSGFVEAAFARPCLGRSCRVTRVGGSGAALACGEGGRTRRCRGLLLTRAGRKIPGTADWRGTNLAPFGEVFIARSWGTFQLLLLHQRRWKF